jgi:hypothetical protein
MTYCPAVPRKYRLSSTDLSFISLANIPNFPILADFRVSVEHVKIRSVSLGTAQKNNIQTISIEKVRISVTHDPRRESNMTCPGTWTRSAWAWDKMQGY